MPRSPFDLTNPNDPIKIYSKEWNAFIEATKEHMRNMNNQLGGESYLTNNYGELFQVATNDFYNFDQFDTLVIVGIFSPLTFTDEIFDNPILEVARYDDSQELHRNAPVCVLQQPLYAAANSGTPVATAKISGSSFINVNLTDIRHTGFKLMPNSAVLESCITGVVSNIGNGGVGSPVAFGLILPEPSEQQFKVIELNENDIVNCITYNDGVEGTEVVKIAMPWVIRRTPFDGKTEDLRNPLIRYEYFSFTERRAFIKDQDEYDAAVAAIEAADQQKQGADKQLEDAEEGGDPQEIEDAEEAVEEAEEAQESSQAAFDALEEEEEDQIINTPYTKNDILIGSKNVVGFGEEDIIDVNGNPVLWLDTNRSSRYWYENLDFEEPEIEEGETA